MNAIRMDAGEREAGVLCPHCGIEVVRGDVVAKCSNCATVHHESCWEGRGCGAYSCAPARREAGALAPATWRITAEELSHAQPMRSTRPATVPGSYGGAFPSGSPRKSRLAIAALICAIAGIPFFGLITGVVAILLGSLALSEIQRDSGKGRWMAITGVVLGLADAAGWLVLLIHLVGSGGGGHSSPRMADFRVDPHQLDSLPATISRAMRANVLLTSHQSFGSEIIGSGIVLKIADGRAQILTNRHVVDPDYDSESSTSSDPASLKSVAVTLIDQSTSLGDVVWLAPGAVDLALISAPCVSTQARAAAWPATRPSQIGDAVFAIGNPHAWGWTHTQGSVSQFRYLSTHGGDVRVIQSSAPINPGNSGGGLYDRDGFLIGVNTWTNDKRVSEGLSFSISLDSFIQFSPPVKSDWAPGVEKKKP